MNDPDLSVAYAPVVNFMNVLSSIHWDIFW